MELPFLGKLVRYSTMISWEEYKIGVSHPLARYYTSTVSYKYWLTVNGNKFQNIYQLHPLYLFSDKNDTHWPHQEIIFNQTNCVNF